MQEVDVRRAIEERKSAWLLEHYHITLYELEHSPLSVQEDLGAAWNRYWRQECTAGRGIKLQPRPAEEQGQPVRASGRRQVA